MKTFFTVRAWATDDILETTDSLESAREAVKRHLSTEWPIRERDKTRLPSDACEGWHESRREGCGSVLIYREIATA